MIYALKIGMGFSFPRKKLHELALSALLHDVGMFLIPEEITDKDQRLSSSDLNVIKQHPVLGSKMLSIFQPPLARRGGLPASRKRKRPGLSRRYPGNEISEFAKIVGLVDSYEAMTHNRPYRKALMQAFWRKS